MFKMIALAFGRTPAPKYPDLSIDPDAMRAIVASRSHGNVRLQAGRFYTAEDVDAEYKGVRDAEYAA
jgi:hypothetical protein